MQKLNVFMTGASGYIGGTVADALMRAGHSVSGLARSEDAAARLRAHGIEPVRGELSSHSVVRNAARGADAVINCANAEDPFVVAAVLEGLAGSGKAFLHTSGTSVVGDKAAGKFSPKVFHEDTPFEPLPEKIQRVAVQRAVLAAAAQGVRSVVLCPCRR
jgi:nucleoside-diphosphate-sugar epimerase